MDASHTLIVRGRNALAMPAGSPQGPLPFAEEAKRYLVVIESYRHGTIEVVTSFTGSPPDEWRWIALIDLQKEVWSDGMADLLGEALLCGGVPT